MFVNRKVYKRQIDDITFKGNDTKGVIQAYTEEGHLINELDKVAHNYAEFQSMTRNMYNQINENRHNDQFF